MVWYCLEKYPETRSSDRTLILYVYAEFFDIYSQPFYAVIARDDLPSFESIRRTRQKIQQEHEELRAVKPVEETRIAKQEEYIAYSREEIAG
jgi:hypothetical protein